MKKVAVWLSDEERGALAQYCEKEGRSMYAVLKQAVARIIQGESPIALEQGIDMVAPSVKPVQVVSPEIEERVGTLERGQSNLAKEFEKLSDHERIWQEISEIKQRLTKLEEINTKEFKKIVADGVVIGFEELGLRPKERV